MTSDSVVTGLGEPGALANSASASTPSTPSCIPTSGFGIGVPNSAFSLPGDRSLLFTSILLSIGDSSFISVSVTAPVLGSTLTALP